MNVENRRRIAVNECRGFDIVKVVADANHVVPTGFVSLEASRVNCLDFAELVERSGRLQQDASDTHFKVLLPRAHGSEVGKLIHRKSEFSGDSRHLVEDIEQPPVRLVEVLTKTVNRDNDPVSVATRPFYSGG